MPVFQLGGREVHVEPWTTWWPLSIINKQQGVEVKVNPDRHWWCLWICETTDEVDSIQCRAELTSTFAANATIDGQCSSCGDLIVKSQSTWGVSAPWLYARADFSGVVRISGQGYSFEGQFLYT